MALGLGDKNLGYQCLKVALSLNNSHAEALNNLGVLEYQKGHADAALAAYTSAQESSPGMHEARYNGALAAFKAGELESAHKQVNEALDCFPEHSQSLELLPLIKGLISSH
jgi:tetratricopeptide repeat protein 8